MKFYTVSNKFYYKNDLISYSTNRTLTDENVQNQKIVLTWYNLEEIYSIYGLFLPFNIWQFKKGRVITFFNSITTKHVKDIKEWKIKQLDNMYMTIEFKENIPSLQTILNWSDGEKAIQYLVEKGLSNINEIIK
jgi:hypothetical protein